MLIFYRSITVVFDKNVDSINSLDTITL